MHLSPTQRSPVRGSSKQWPVYVCVLNAREQSRRRPRRHLIVSHVTSRFNSNLGLFPIDQSRWAFVFLQLQPRPLKNPIKE